MDKLLDFSFADEICAPLYSTRGPKPYAPSLKLKLHFVQRYYNLLSSLGVRTRRTRSERDAALAPSVCLSMQLSFRKLHSFILLYG